MSVAIIDRSVFPRNKLCGGLLTVRSKNIFESIFETNWDKVIEVISKGACFYFNDEFSNSTDNYRPFYFTSRDVFDTFLLELAEKKGAKVYQGSQVVSINKFENIVTTKKGKSYKADFIIGADGVHSRVAKSILRKSFDKRQLAFGIETSVPRNIFGRDIIRPEIYFGVTNWGYGWIFPKKEKLTIGVAGLWSANKNLKKSMLKFLKQILEKTPDVKIKGHYLPFGRYLSTPGKENILLIGDAAGLVDPITGEGIAFAMQSGKFAAESILEASSYENFSSTINIY
jgi:geranylgeranyl reductase family protein